LVAWTSAASGNVPSAPSKLQSVVSVPPEVISKIVESVVP
jgi:hypothetical protein